MTLEEACLYLNINPDDDDIDLDQLEKNYKAKLSIYDLKRFNYGTPEYREAKRMRSNIEEKKRINICLMSMHSFMNLNTKRLRAIIHY